VERFPYCCCLVYVHARVCVEECWVVVPCQACDKIPREGGAGAWGRVRRGRCACQGLRAVVNVGGVGRFPDCCRVRVHAHVCVGGGVLRGRDQSVGVGGVRAKEPCAVA
jgi:hypothetical protein